MKIHAWLHFFLLVFFTSQQVLLVNSPKLPNIESVVETSRGKLSTHLDLDSPSDCRIFDGLIADSHVFVQVRERRSEWKIKIGLFANIPRP